MDSARRDTEREGMTDPALSDNQLRELLRSRIGTPDEQVGDKGWLSVLERRHESMHLLPSGSTGVHQPSEGAAVWGHGKRKRGRPPKENLDSA